MFDIRHPDIIALVELAIREDKGLGDITTSAIYTGSETATGLVIAKENGIIAGLEIARLVTQMVNSELVIETFVRDGDSVADGQKILKIGGRAAGILTAERTLLNFLQRMSGIATRTRIFTDAIAHTGAQILDTRKTVPGNRLTDKWAVKIGGGTNHRMRLDDMFLIKENHITVAGSIREAIRRCAEYKHIHQLNVPLEVEVRNIDELNEALDTASCDYILLDNMDNDTLREAVVITAGRSRLEASGNMSVDRITGVAETGVDFISAGAITHSTVALDLSMVFNV
jgi:nicotinate-nucleotide pyrophosphorylase (carboxylating)